MKTTVTIHWNKGLINRNHNERTEKYCFRQKTIDYENKHGASTHEIWMHHDLVDAYRQIFGEAIKDYNIGKRPCRQLTPEKYMETVKNDNRGRRQTKKVNDQDGVQKKVVNYDAPQGKRLSYEVTIKIGNTERAKDKNGRVMYDKDGHHIRPEELPRDLQKIILRRYYESFQAANSNLILINCYYHADEGFLNRKGVWEYATDGIHLEFVPVKTGYEKGLRIQNSMGGALRAMITDYDYKDDSNGVGLYDAWAKKEQARLEAIVYEEYEKYCADHQDFASEKGELEIYHPVHDRLKKGDRNKERYAFDQELDEKIADADEKIADADAKITILEEMQTTINAQLKDINDREAALEELPVKEKALNKHKSELDERDKEQNNRDEELNLRDKQQAERQKKLDIDTASLAAQLEELEKRKKELEQREKTIELKEKEFNIVRHSKKPDGSSGSDGGVFSDGANKSSSPKKDDEIFDLNNYQ